MDDIVNATFGWRSAFVGQESSGLRGRMPSMTVVRDR